MKKSESHCFRILKLSIKICVEKLRCAAGHLRHFFLKSRLWKHQFTLLYEKVKTSTVILAEILKYAINLLECERVIIIVMYLNITGNLTAIT